MIRRVLGRFVTWFGGMDGSDGEDADTDDSGDARFVPSGLDSSVRYAHGGGNADGERAITEVREEASKLADQQHRR